MAKRVYGVAIAMLLAAAGALTAQEPQAARSPRPGKVVELTAGSCVSVEAGDLISFTWNPVFTPANNVVGIGGFELGFDLVGAEGSAGRGRSQLTLEAIPPRSSGHLGAENAVADAGNGYYKLHFLVPQLNLPSGEYHLRRAAALPKLANPQTDTVPAMSNTPTASMFCLTLSNTSTGRRR
ncbi:hypothetical protein ACFQBQ_12000 [Granulicella cerasi]|uniref:Secreted protein n=1 Tax=Granulicella cerasi TaxID=741063 RepID=A0ABW1ZAV7_9BACT|nr:hypothetical protein [Granulicella cerasi]